LGCLMARDLDYLASRLHGRRSRMAEAERLDGLCRMQSLPDLARTIFPATEFRGAAYFQRQLVQELIGELSAFPGYVGGAGAGLLDWMLTRFQVENLKVLIRLCVTKGSVEELQEHLVFLPKKLGLQVEALAAALTPADFAGLLPKGPLRKSLEEAVEIYRDNPRSFFFEAALDHGYFHELLARVERLSGEDQGVIKALVCQEVDIFHLMLVMRGKFYYGLGRGLLLPLHVPGTLIPRVRFAAMLDDPDLRTAVGWGVERVLDEVSFEGGSSDVHTPVNAAAVESLAWKRFLRLANRAFRYSHMGLGAIVGYEGIRRLEVANVITISEGIRMGMAADIIRSRLIPRMNVEAAYV
jgi:vacuolar-type H+-ATPase subunit C/Vma6